MREVVSFDKPTICIIHFVQDEEMAAKVGTRIVRFQALLDGNKVSPSGEFIRIDHSQHSEVNGWIYWEDIVIDEVLRELSSEEIEVYKEAA